LIVGILNSLELPGDSRRAGKRSGDIYQTKIPVQLVFALFCIGKRGNTALISAGRLNDFAFECPDRNWQHPLSESFHL
jgi:hypothetical protein